tara:strand:+ start:324 stop:485 length:162 start_codon:yes stop_codon:yes gene_type:complete
VAAEERIAYQDGSMDGSELRENGNPEGERDLAARQPAYWGHLNEERSDGATVQ